jgi:BioD-like phosphotransacetylase family protein
MDTTPEEEANPVLLAFKKITTQLEKLDERDKRAEVREHEAQEREQALIEQHNKVSLMMVKLSTKYG